MVLNNQLIFDQIPGSIGWKNTDLKYMAANINLLSQMNLQHQEELIGLDDTKLALHPPKIIELFRGQDLMVLEGHSLELIHNLEPSTENKTYFLKKSPLRDEQQQIIGVIFHCTSWPQENLLNSLKNADRNFCPAESIPDSYTFDAQQNPAKLSIRELECLFLQLRGNTAKQIADILALSKRTIESYIDNIKSKLGCQNKSELLMTAMMNGYHQVVPKSLLKLNLPDLLKS